MWGSVLPVQPDNQVYCRIGWRNLEENHSYPLLPPPPQQPHSRVMPDELRGYWEHPASNSIVNREGQAVESVPDEISEAISYKESHTGSRKRGQLTLNI